jgi:putative hydrolase of the HAD superfamily
MTVPSMTVPSAILFDAGGVLVYPDSAGTLPLLREAGVDPSHEDLRRAHYYAMRATETDDSSIGHWWASYLHWYAVSCGVDAQRAVPLANRMAQEIPSFSWTLVAPGVHETLAGLAALGIPMGVVSNAEGTVEEQLGRLGVCHARGNGHREGVEMAAIIDSTVVGVWKPDPAIFGFALEALGLPAGEDIWYVGDTIRYDVTGALAAGLTPVHMDPYADCLAPDGHRHIRDLPELLDLAGTRPRGL